MWKWVRKKICLVYYVRVNLHYSLTIAAKEAIWEHLGELMHTSQSAASTCFMVVLQVLLGP